jgi:serine protease Do
MKEVKSESSIKTFQLHKNYRKRIISAGEFEISDLKLPKETGAERCFAVDKKKQVRRGALQWIKRNRKNIIL